jgi:hypothetical protein
MDIINSVSSLSPIPGAVRGTDGAVCRGAVRHREIIDCTRRSGATLVAVGAARRARPAASPGGPE